MAPRARFPAAATHLHVCESTSLPVCRSVCKSWNPKGWGPHDCRPHPQAYQAQLCLVLAAQEQEESPKIILSRLLFQVSRRWKRRAVLGSHQCWGFSGHPPSSASNPSARRCCGSCSGCSGGRYQPKPQGLSRANQTWESDLALCKSPPSSLSNPLLMNGQPRVHQVAFSPVYSQTAHMASLNRAADLSMQWIQARKEKPPSGHPMVPWELTHVTPGS